MGVMSVVCGGCLGCREMGGRPPTVAELETVRELVAKARERFEPETKDAHLALLRRLWTSFHDNVRGVKKPFERVSADWQKIGFQNADPASDVRGGGVLAIENMLAFVTASPDAAIAMAEDREAGGAGSEAGYLPWATAGVNVTRLLLEMFGAVSPNGYEYPDVSASRLRCWPLVHEFDRLYALVFKMLDASFEAEHGDYMSFPHVKATVLHRLQVTAKRHGCVTVLELEELLRRRHWAEFRKLSLPAEERQRIKDARRRTLRKHIRAVVTQVHLQHACSDPDGSAASVPACPDPTTPEVVTPLRDLQKTTDPSTASPSAETHPPHEKNGGQLEPGAGDASSPGGARDDHDAVPDESPGEEVRPSSPGDHRPSLPSWMSGIAASSSPPSRG